MRPFLMSALVSKPNGDGLRWGHTTGHRSTIKFGTDKNSVIGEWTLELTDGEWRLEHIDAVELAPELIERIAACAQS